MPFTYNPEATSGEYATGEWAEARAYVAKHEGDNVVVDVWWYVQRQIFGERERMRTREIADAVGHDIKKVRRALMGLFGAHHDGDVGKGWLGYVDIGAASDGCASSRMRTSGVNLGASDYKWEVYFD